MINNIRKILYVVLGFLLFYSYIWYRFIRERLPRDIPFDLSVFYFFYLISICLLYTYVLYKIYKPLPLGTQFQFNNKITEFVGEMLEAFHNTIKKLIKPLIFSLYIIFENKDLYFWQIIFICGSFLPRLLLLIVFYLDVFYFLRLNYIYNIIFLGLCFFFWPYFYYFLNEIKNNLIKELEIDLDFIYILFIPNEVIPENVKENLDTEEDDKYYDDDDDEEVIFDDETKTILRGLTVKQFLQYKKEKLLEESLDVIDYSFAYSLIFCKKMSLKYNIEFVAIRIRWPLKPDQRKLLQEPLIEKINLILSLELFIEKLIQASTIVMSLKELHNIMILIYLNYLISWLYILVISVQTLNILDLIVLLEQTYKYIEEPFSNG